MGWGNLRLQIWQNQNGRCSVCNRPVSLTGCVCHHKKNRCQGGETSVANGEARHPHCEQLMHKLYKHGNKNEGMTKEAKKMTWKDYYEQMHGRKASEFPD